MSVNKKGEFTPLQSGPVISDIKSEHLDTSGSEPPSLKSILHKIVNVKPFDENNSDIRESRKAASEADAVDDLSTEACQKRFAKNVDGVFNGTIRAGKSIILGNTPVLLQDYGAKKLPITISQATMFKIAYPKGYFGAEKQGHNLGIPALKQLPGQIADPIAIIKSNTQHDSMVLLTEWFDTEGKSVIIPIHLDKNGALGLVNNIASAYGKKQIFPLLKDSNGKSNILYTKNNEDIHTLLSNRLQLPDAIAEDTLIDYSLSHHDNTVKRSDENNSDIRESRQAAPEPGTSLEKYSYTALISKPAMPVTLLTETVPLNENGKIDRTKVKEIALTNARKQNNPKNTDANTFVHVDDLDIDVVVGDRGIRHGLVRKADTTVRAAMQIGDILKNSISINELNARKNTTGGYILLGTGKDIEGNYYPTRIIINNYEVEDIEPLGVVYAINAKKERVARLNDAGFAANAAPLRTTPSTISIADLLDIVKSHFPDTMPQKNRR